jgi:hypothetical protein
MAATQTGRPPPPATAQQVTASLVRVLVLFFRPSSSFLPCARTQTNAREGGKFDRFVNTSPCRAISFEILQRQAVLPVDRRLKLDTVGRRCAGGDGPPWAGGHWGRDGCRLVTRALRGPPLPDARFGGLGPASAGRPLGSTLTRV